MSAFIPCAYGSIGRWNPGLTRLAPPVAMIWSSSNDAEHVGPPLLGYDRAFCVASRGLLALRPETGEELWRLDTQRGWGSCQLADRLLLSTPRPGLLAVLDPMTGSLMESFSAAGLLLYEGVVVHGRIISPVEMGTLAAWDLTSRNFAWRVPSGWESQMLAAGRELVCVPEESSYVALEVKTGAERWRFDVSELGRHSTILWGERPGATAGRPVVNNDTMYGGVSGGWLVAIDLASGAKRWQLQVGGLSPRNHTLAPDGNLIFLSDDELFEIDPALGSVISRKQLTYPAGAAGGGPFAPIAIAERFVWTVDKRAQLVAISRLDASVTVCHSVGNRVAEAPVIGDGRLFLVDLKGRMGVFAQTNA